MTFRRGAARPLVLAALAALCLSGPPAHAGHAPLAAAETRAMWVLRASLSSPDSIAALVKSAKDHGFNTLFVQVRGRGDAYYRSGVERIPAELQRQSASFDPLGTVLDASRAAGLRVHAWVNLNLVSSATDLPADREHVVHRHPDWLMVPRDIAQELAAVPIDSPAYVGKLARWTRTQSADVEGLYASPILPASAAYTESIVRDIARRYAVDGVHFDYARYPTERFDYSRAAIREFRAVIRPTLDDATRRSLDGAETVDLFAYPDALPGAWHQFRVARMTALIARLRGAVKAERPAAIVSVAAAPDLTEALTRRLQDWGAWLDAGLIDALCPMAYTQDPARFAEQIAAARHTAGGRPVWAGIGAYRLSPAQTIDNILTARKLGAAGVILFSYDSIRNPRQSAPDYMATIGRAVFADRAAADAGSR
jgi:uncharacterized lipoprotein YddW (UPF0748 family)